MSKKYRILVLTLFSIFIFSQISFGANINQYRRRRGAFAFMNTTKGTIVIRLALKKAPITCYNFIKYAKDRYYNGTIFHRVIPNFMIQGGGFLSSMRKKPGLRKPIFNEWKNGLKNKKFTIAMARLGGRADSATSQFFINVNDNSFLDRPNDGAAYAVFGKVIDGFNVVESIVLVDKIRHPMYPSQSAVTPKTAIVIKNIRIVGRYSFGRLRTQFKNYAKKKKLEERRAKAKLKRLCPDIARKMGKRCMNHTSGLKYIIVKPGQGKTPSSSSAKVTVHYEGRLVSGKIFDSSYRRGKPISFPLNRVIRGWTIGVGQMRVGETRILIIPPNLGYGARGAGRVIPPNAWLIFKVELIATE